MSPKGEKAYDERVLAWRLKRIEAYTHSRIQWALGSSNRGGRNKNHAVQGDFVEDLDLQDSDSHRQSLRKVSINTSISGGYFATFCC